MRKECIQGLFVDLKLVTRLDSEIYPRLSLYKTRSAATASMPFTGAYWAISLQRKMLITTESSASINKATFCLFQSSIYFFKTLFLFIPFILPINYSIILSLLFWEVSQSTVFGQSRTNVELWNKVKTWMIYPWFFGLKHISALDEGRIDWNVLN